VHVAAVLLLSLTPADGPPAPHSWALVDTEELPAPVLPAAPVAPPAYAAQFVPMMHAPTPVFLPHAYSGFGAPFVPAFGAPFVGGAFGARPFAPSFCGPGGCR
jgi:hypothetical protein